MSTNFLTRVLTKAFTFILISTLLTFLIVTIHASDALSLDTSFGADGKVTTSFSAGNDVGSGIAVQSDDKIVVVGTSDNGSGTSEFAVARFNVDGSLDTSFNVDGMVTTFFSAGNDIGSGIAVQSDDKIVVVGTSDSGSGNSEFAVTRFNVDGSLDTSFNGDGLVTASFLAGNDLGSGIGVQSDGKIVVVGTSDDLSTTWLAVARFTVNGSLDPSFGVGGTVLSISSSNGDDMGSGNAVQSDDRTVVVGSSDDGSGKWRFVVARFNIDASFPDPAIDSGKAITSFTAGDDVGSGIAVQSDGRIVVVGTADDGSGDSDFAVARYPADLSLTGGGGDGGGGGGGGGGCFIATAAYGSPMQPYVKVLHEFRDRFLPVNTVGKGFEPLYNTYSPPIVNLIADNDSRREIVRLSLIPFVGVSWVALKIGFVPTMAFMLLFGSGFIGFVWFRQKYKE